MDRGRKMNTNNGPKCSVQFSYQSQQLGSFISFPHTLAKPNQTSILNPFRHITRYSRLLYRGRVSPRKSDSSKRSASHQKHNSLDELALIPVTLPEGGVYAFSRRLAIMLLCTAGRRVQWIQPLSKYPTGCFPPHIPLLSWAANHIDPGWGNLSGIRDHLGFNHILQGSCYTPISKVGWMHMPALSDDTDDDRELWQIVSNQKGIYCWPKMKMIPSSYTHTSLGKSANMLSMCLVCFSFPGTSC